MLADIFRFAADDPFRPTPEEERRIERYRRLWLYYAPPGGDPYGTAEGGPSLAALKDLPDYTASFFNYVPYVVDADLFLLLGEFGEKSVSAPAAGKEGIQALRRAGFVGAVHKAFESALVCGDAWVKVLPGEEGGVRLVTLDPAAVHPRLDPHDHTRVLSVLIHYRYRDAKGRLRERSELWEGGRVTVKDDGKPVPAESGEHPFGRPPLVHFACRPLPGSYFGRPAFEEILADMDRLNAAAGAVLEVFRYYGSPKLVLKGVVAPQCELDPDVRQFWQLPSGDAELSFLEWRNASGLVDEVLKLDEVVRRKLPEFVLEAIAQRTYPASGYAVSLQLSLLEAKIRSLAAGFSAALDELAALALAAAGLDPEGAKVELVPMPAATFTGNIRQAERRKR